MKKRSLSFEQFARFVDIYISRRIGVGLLDLADVDIWGFWTPNIEPDTWWQVAIRDAAIAVMEEQDLVDEDIMMLF